MAQGGSLIVPRWSIRVSLTIPCLWNSQSVCTLLWWWPYVDRLNFNAYHLSRIGYRSDWKDLSISTFESQRRGFIVIRNCDAECRVWISRELVFVPGWMIRRQTDICFAFIMSSHDSILDRETKLRRALPCTWSVRRSLMCALSFVDTFFNYMTSGFVCMAN